MDRDGLIRQIGFFLLVLLVCFRGNWFCLLNWFCVQFVFVGVAIVGFWWCGNFVVCLSV